MSTVSVSTYIITTNELIEVVNWWKEASDHYLLLHSFAEIQENLISISIKKEKRWNKT